MLALAGCLGGDDDGMDDGTTSAADGMDDDGMDDDGMAETSTDEEGGMNEGEDSMMETATVTVRVENAAPVDFYPDDASTNGAVWFTPGAYAVHTGENPVYTAGEVASVGLEALAEAGPPTGFEGEPGLVDELGDSMDVVHAGAYTPEDTVADPNDPMGEVPGAPPIAPGGAFEFDVEAEPGHRLSLASMFVPSNDVFVSADSAGIPLWPEDGGPVDGDVSDHLLFLDAGTEPNAEPPGFGPDQAPAQDAPAQGDDENGVVRPLSAVDDGHDYPAVTDAIRVTLTPQ